MGRDERRRWGTVPPSGGESVGKAPVDGGRGQSADDVFLVIARGLIRGLPLETNLFEADSSSPSTWNLVHNLVGNTPSAKRTIRLITHNV